MHTHRTHQTIISLPICQLYPHPDNANRMSQVKFKKLISHLETTGQYEPLVVRKHPTKVNSWQLLNGHHRLRALRQLKHARIDCVVFAAVTPRGIWPNDWANPRRRLKSSPGCQRISRCRKHRENRFCCR